MDKKVQLKIFNFNSITPPPSYKPNKKGNFIEWGEKNQHSEYLLKLFNSSGSNIHKAIINRKIKMIAGQGFTNPQLDDKFKLKELVKRLASDYEIYNGFAIEVIYNNGGEVSELNHVPIFKIRRGLETDKVNFPYFWVSTDWSKFNKEEHQPQFIREYNPNLRTGRQLFYYIEYNPESEIYPIPSYSNTLNWIELDYEISKFHLNQAKNGYAPSFILNFATGIPTEEEMEETVRNFKRDFKGTEGDTLLVTFSEGNEQKPTLERIELNDSDERFINLSEQIREKIFIGHEVTNPQLFGVMVPGQLGGLNEMVESLDIFQAIYIDQRQEAIENALNYIIKPTEPLKLQKFTLTPREN